MFAKIIVFWICFKLFLHLPIVKNKKKPTEKFISYKVSNNTNSSTSQYVDYINSYEMIIFEKMHFKDKGTTTEIVEEISTVFSSYGKKNETLKYLLTKMLAGDYYPCRIFINMHLNVTKLFDEQFFKMLYKYSSPDFSSICQKISKYYIEKNKIQLYFFPFNSDDNSPRFTQKDKINWEQIKLDPIKDNHLIVTNEDRDWGVVKFHDRYDKIYNLIINRLKEHTYNCFGFAIGIPAAIEPIYREGNILYYVGLNGEHIIRMIYFYISFYSIQEKLEILNQDPMSMIQKARRNELYLHDFKPYNDESSLENCSIEGELIIFYYKEGKLVHAAKRVKYTHFFISKLGDESISIHTIDLYEEEYGKVKLYWCSRFINSALSTLQRLNNLFQIRKNE